MANEETEVETPPAEEKPAEETPPAAVEEKPDPNEARFKSLEERLDKLLAASEKPKVDPPKPKSEPKPAEEPKPAAAEKPRAAPEPAAYGSRRWFGNR